MRRMLGEVDLLGLESLWQDSGTLPTVAGAAAGAALSRAASMVASNKPVMTGVLAGAVAAVAAHYASDRTRPATLGIIAGTVFGSGLFEQVVVKALSVFGIGPGSSVAGVGLPTVNYLNGNLGLPEVQYAPPVYGSGLGLPGIYPEPPAYGVWNKQPVSGGIAGPQLGQAPPVDLLGQPTAQSQALEMMGGPTISGLANAYGATLFGGGN
jgi:hypothetical protein